jgi:hypothetical protein
MLTQYLHGKSRNLNRWVTFTYTNLLLHFLVQMVRSDDDVTYASNVCCFRAAHYIHNILRLTF